MRVTTKARLAVAAMVDVALQSRQGATSLSDVSRRQGISLSYLEQLFSRLRRAGLVSSSRGPGGGYSLARVASAISAADIVRAVDDEPATRDPSREAGWPTSAGRLDVDSLWSDAAARMFEILESATLDALARREEAAGAAIEPKTGGLGRWGEPTPAASKVDAPNSVFDMGDRARR